MILSLYFFACFFFFSGIMLLLAVFTFGGAGVCCLLFCCVSLARYLLLKVVCWPCRAGKAYRRPRPPTLTPQVPMYFTLELHVLY